MPLTLFVEGVEKSLDFRCLSEIIPQGTILKPAGSRYGLGTKIEFLRQNMPPQELYALRDRDFDADPTAPKAQPRRWEVRDNNQVVHIGWTWERKEIENYLLDPEVVDRAFKAGGKRMPPKYPELLSQAAARLATYTAARTALSLSRHLPPPLQNNWGPKMDGWPLPTALDEAACRAEMARILATYPSPEPADTMALFETYLPLYAPEGIRGTQYLTYFAGKDLLRAMKPDLQACGITAHTLPQQVLKGMYKAQDDVWQWLPEWQALHRILLEI